MPLTPSSGLTQYYRDIGAYGDITPDDGETTPFTPSQPPPVYAPAPASLTATASGETTALGEESADLSWSSVTGASGYHVQRRVSGARAVVYCGRERYGHEPHGNRPVVRQDARIQSGRVRGWDNLQREGGPVVPHGDGYHGSVQPSASEVQGGLVLVRDQRPRSRWETRWALCRPST